MLRSAVPDVVKKYLSFCCNRLITSPPVASAWLDVFLLSDVFNYSIAITIFSHVKICLLISSA